MGTLTIKSRTIQTSYEYVNENVTVNGGYTQENATGNLRSINGSVVLKATGAQIGGFNGYRSGQTMVYNQSDVPFEQLTVFMTAIQEIEQEINGSESDNTEGGES